MVAPTGTAEVLPGIIRDASGAIFDAKHPWHGLKGDDSTDDSANFNALVTRIIDAGGGVLYLPPGIYVIDANELDVPKVSNQPIRIVGAGRNSTYLKFTATSGTLLQVQPDNVTVEHLTLEGPGNDGDTADGLLVRNDSGGSGPKHNTLRDVRIMKFGGVGLINDGFANGADGLWIFDCGVGIREDSSGGHVAYRHGFVTGCTDEGILFNGTTNNFALRDFNVESNRVGVFGSGASSAPRFAVFDNVHFEGNDERDCRFGVGTEDVTFISCRIAGVDSRTINSVEHVGGSPNRHRMIFIGCRFVGEPHATGITELVKAGSNVDVCFPSSLGGRLADGCAIENVTLSESGTRNENSRLIMGNSMAWQEVEDASGSTTLDFADGEQASLTLTGNITLENPSNVVAGREYLVRFNQDGTGGRSVSFGSNWKGDPSINTTADKRTTTLWRAFNSNTLVQVANTEEA